MKATRTAGTLGLMALAIVTSPFAMADASPWYVGGNIGQATAKIDNPNITNSQLGNGFITTSISDDTSHTGYKLFGGFQFNSNLAFEAGYFDVGNFGFTATTKPTGTLTGSTKIKGLNFDVVGILPFTADFSGFARFGLDYADATDSFNGNGFVSVRDSSPSKQDISYKFGLGLQYDFTRSFGGRVEVERYRVKPADSNSGDIDLFSLGLVYRFGG